MKEVFPSVSLIEHTNNPEKVIANAARLCYADDSDVRHILDTENSNKDDSRLVEMLIKMGHLSPLEHASFSFLIEGVSRAMTHQLVRHRIASYSQRSQRYVKHEGFDFVIPDSIKKAGLEADYLEMMQQSANNYSLLNKELAKRLGKKGEEVNQDARYVLPNACESKIITTMNARSLLHFFEERLCHRAQWEIRDVAEQMLEKSYEVAPNIFTYAGPACYNGKCRQGKKSCGKSEEIAENLNKRFR